MNWRLALVTFFGSGLAPAAPGTAGSLLAALILLAVHLLFPMSWWTWNVILMGGLAVSGVICVALGDWTFAHFNRKDPGPCVIDEAAGICLTALFLPIYPSWRGGITLALVFAAFRVFDIVKLPPARQLETLTGGWGILMDDLAAAVYANLVCQALVRFVL